MFISIYEDDNSMPRRKIHTKQYKNTQCVYSTQNEAIIEIFTWINVQNVTDFNGKIEQMLQGAKTQTNSTTQIHKK